MARKATVEKGSGYQSVVYALALSNGVSLFLLAIRILGSQTFRYWFLAWNLLLAWLPLLFAWMLVQRLARSPWSAWQNVLLSVLWLGFLPNSFYLVSDLIHLRATGEVSLLYDIIMFFSFIFNAYLAGIVSLYLVHRELLKQLVAQWAHTVVAIVLVACSFAIYLGRSLRWNTWDVLVNPAGILFDVSDSIVNPVGHPQSFVTTVTFFLLLGSMYFVIWQLVEALRADNR